jgi:hypothetical protein
MGKRIPRRRSSRNGHSLLRNAWRCPSEPVEVFVCVDPLCECYGVTAVFANGVEMHRGFTPLERALGSAFQW